MPIRSTSRASRDNGQYTAAAALRRNITGNLVSPVTVFWNVEKK